MSKLYNNSGILGCKTPQKSGNSPQKVGKMVIPAQECENLENPTYGTHLAAPFAAPAQCAAGVKTGNGAVEQCAAVENLDTAAHAQSVAGGKFANGVELGVAERCYVAGDETNSILSGSSVKTQQIFANTHKCFVQKANNNTNKACRTAKKQVAGGDFCYGSARKSRAHACDKLAGNNCGNTLVRARSLSGKSGNGTVEQSVAGVKSAKKHSKVLRAVACGCLAILMCGTAFLGTACSGGTPANVGFNGGSAAAVGAGGSAASINYGNGTTGNAGLSAGADQNFATQGGGLITPRADDPVIFETKDGLEIKFGAGLPSNTNIGEVADGWAAGRPYFQTTGTNNIVYTWVIVGAGHAVDRQLNFWQKLSNVTTAMRNEYKNNIFDLTSPAGDAIAQYQRYFANIVVNSEISDGYVLITPNIALVGEAIQRSNAATDTVLPALLNEEYTLTGLAALGLTVKSHNLDGYYPNLFPPGFGEYAFPYERYGLALVREYAYRDPNPQYRGVVENVWLWKSAGSTGSYYNYWYISTIWQNTGTSKCSGSNIALTAYLECKLW